jgi:hypothetical protein
MKASNTTLTKTLQTNFFSYEKVNSILYQTNCIYIYIYIYILMFLTGENLSKKMFLTGETLELEGANPSKDNSCR